MPKPLADRVLGLKPSATVEITERVRVARASGRKIIALSSGDPNIDTDPRIIAAAERALRQGDTRYGPPAGLPALREAIAGREQARSGVSYGPCVQLCGGVPIGISMLDRIDEATLERAVSPRSKAIIVNSPVNPTGRVLSAAEIGGVLTFAERHDLWILFDQV